MRKSSCATAGLRCAEGGRSAQIWLSRLFHSGGSIRVGLLLSLVMIAFDPPALRLTSCVGLAVAKARLKHRPIHLQIDSKGSHYWCAWRLKRGTLTGTVLDNFFRFEWLLRALTPPSRLLDPNLRLKRSAFWFLGEYCCQLTGAPIPSDQAQNSDKSPSAKPNPTGSNDLLDAWASPAPNRSDSVAGRPQAGLVGLEGESRAVAHPVVAAMNGATVSILMRLKHAAMFEDFQVCLLFCH